MYKGSAGVRTAMPGLREVAYDLETEQRPVWLEGSPRVRRAMGEEVRGPIRQDLAGYGGIWILLREFRQVSSYLKTI